MFKRAAFAFLLCISARAEVPYRGELSLSHAKRVIEGGTPSVYRDGRTTTLGVGCSFILNSTNALRLRYEKSIAVPSLPNYDSSQPSVRREKDFQSISVAYLHWFGSESVGGWFIGSSASINRTQQDTNMPSRSGFSTETSSNSGRAAFVSGYQIGKSVGLEFHAGLPYSSASIVCRF